ncbi:MAG: hypothetical protein WAW79_04425, partial [Steroidobacteraceae bacterium]
ISLAALTVGIVTTVVLLPRADDAAVAPENWIVEAAGAFNRGTGATEQHGATRVPPGAESAAQQSAHEGERLRVQRRFAEAAAAYREAVDADPMDADSWADLADSAAAAAGNDLSGSREAIMRALAIDPRHRKALWLRASLELQEQRYVAAAATWRELHALVPVGSSDARVVAANIAEADALVQMAPLIAARGN